MYDKTGNALLDMCSIISNKTGIDVYIIRIITLIMILSFNVTKFFICFRFGLFAI